MHEYFIEYATSIGVKQPSKTVKKVLKDESYMTKNVYKILREHAKQNMKKTIDIEKGQPYYKKKIKAEIIECTARISPLCLKRFVKTSEKTVCVKCKIML